MGKKTIDDIRSLIDPQGFLRALEAGRERIEAQVAALLVDYEMAENTPHLSSERRKNSLDEIERAIKDGAWRIEQIDERIAGLKGENRASRRRKK